MRGRGSRPERGFSLIELMMVVIIVGILTAIAFPALRTFSGRNSDVGEATLVARTINEARDFARRRNRAYIMNFTFDGAEPNGRITIHEGNSASCLSVAANVPGNSREVGLTLFGQEQAPGESANYDRVGLRGWIAPNEELAAMREGPVLLCLSPDGAASMKAGAAPVTPISDRLRIAVQQHSPVGEGWRIDGPPRLVEVSFSGGAQLELK